MPILKYEAILCPRVSQRFKPCSPGVGARCGRWLSVWSRSGKGQQGKHPRAPCLFFFFSRTGRVGRSYDLNCSRQRRWFVLRVQPEGKAQPLRPQALTSIGSHWICSTTLMCFFFLSCQRPQWNKLNADTSLSEVPVDAHAGPVGSPTPHLNVKLSSPKRSPVGFLVAV